MKRFFIENFNYNQKTQKISGDQFLHMTRVLRMKEGDLFFAICGDGKEYECKIQQIQPDWAEFVIEKVSLAQTDAKSRVAVFQACVKGDKFDLIIQKLSELGVSTLIPFDSDYSIAKCQEGKTQRYNKIASEACKQCRRTIPMEVQSPKKFCDIIKEIKNYDIAVFCNEHEQTRPLREIFKDFGGKSVAIIIGSEGGFSPKEIEKLSEVAYSTTLGKRILRAETAAIVAAGCVMLLLGELE